MHSDHCAKEKKDVELMRKEKLVATYQSLREDQIMERSNKDLLPYFLEAQKKMIASVEGQLK